MDRDRGTTSLETMYVMARSGDMNTFHVPSNSASNILRRKLTREQEGELHALISAQAPDALGFDALLWNRDAVGELVRQRTGVELPLRTLTTYLERWGFAPEKPLKSLFHQRPALMREWMRKDYPIIAMRARESNAVLSWLGVEPLVARDHSRRGSTNVLWPADRLGILFVVTNRGHLQWLIHGAVPSLDQLITFMTRVVQGTGRPQVMIAQHHPLFSEAEFIDWSFRNERRVVIHQLPAELSADTGSSPV